MAQRFRAGLSLALLAIALGASGGCIFSGVTIAQSTSENPALPEPLSSLAINGFYIPFRVAQNQGIDTPEELERALRTEKIPYFVDLGATWGRIHPGAFGSFAWENIDPDLDGKNFNFTYQDIYIRMAQKNGVQLLPSLSPFKEDLWLTTTS